MGKGLEKTLRGFQKEFSPLAFTFFIINDFKEEK
jgi:hypothetical protein